MQKRLTIKDLANELNLHYSTVSRALNNYNGIKKTTKVKVLEAAREYGYQVNLNAVHLRAASNNTIALIIPNIRHTFFTNIVSHISKLAYKKGYVVSIFESNENYKQEQEIINRIIKYNYSGVIASISKNTINAEHFRLLRKYNIPLVFFDRVGENIDTSKVLINNYESAYQAAEILIKKGYKRIAYISGPIHLNVFKDRLQGYKNALTKYKIGYNHYIIINKEFTIEDGKNALERLLEKDEKPDAVFSTSSILSIGIILKAKALKINIPDDLGIIGFGDNDISSIIDPGITSIIQPEDEISEQCFEIMMDMMNINNIDNLVVREVKTKIIFRGSI